MPHSPPVPWPKLTQRQAILVRLAIYLPLIAYFGWGAYQTYRAEQDARARTADDGKGPEILGTPKAVTLPDGSTITVYELTEDQARAMGIDPDATRGPALSAAPGAAPAEPPPNASSTAPTPSPKP